MRFLLNGEAGVFFTMSIATYTLHLVRVFLYCLTRFETIFANREGPDGGCGISLGSALFAKTKLIIRERNVFF